MGGVGGPAVKVRLVMADKGLLFRLARRTLTLPAPCLSTGPSSHLIFGGFLFDFASWRINKLPPLLLVWHKSHSAAPVLGRGHSPSCVTQRSQSMGSFPESYTWVSILGGPLCHCSQVRGSQPFSFPGLVCVTQDWRMTRDNPACASVSACE